MAPTASTRTVEIDLIGGGRAAITAQQQLAKLFEPSDAMSLTLRQVDAAPGKAMRRAEEATALGIASHPRETTGQVAIAEAGNSDRPLIINIDDPAACAECLMLAAKYNRRTVVTLFIQLPNGRLVALRAAFAATDRVGKRALAAFLVTLGKVTQRAGSSKVWGPDAPPANILLEPAMRAWFAVAYDRAFAFGVGIATEGAPVELTYDGVETLPLFIRDSGSGFADRETLAKEIAEQTVTPIAPGTSFAIAEVGADAIHLVDGRLRKIDRTIAIDTFEAIDSEAYAEAERRREEARRVEIAESLRRAEEARITRLNPVYVTD